ncbi:hypothetical protein CG478_005325 [Bacillus cytotoxicus]|uniref:hypothetical protein n=1 Tax=Bacillus cytotoxicus TaxID=580165 RepID=UPI000863CD25|nr:hypothetical protein CG483_009935 [Bacillus cytotoxicus]AWC39961.1 hypothetical protein CG480_005325 [Bacillus cytotoxicus]AWC47892.1 hypothetical protein CG478_005325 [Bacillus cytotoxicus]AWC52723.1 hypothetical protein CG477_009890 [Bacillus cytotoxicus]AWC56855.1 hypothetical protein CG476_009920 [Bacillus cytotoxicus]
MALTKNVARSYLQQRRYAKELFSTQYDLFLLKGYHPIAIKLTKQNTPKNEKEMKEIIKSLSLCVKR